MMDDVIFMHELHDQINNAPKRKKNKKEKGRKESLLKRLFSKFKALLKQRHEDS